MLGQQAPGHQLSWRRCPSPRTWSPEQGIFLCPWQPPPPPGEPPKGARLGGGRGSPAARTVPQKQMAYLAAVPCLLSATRAYPVPAAPFIPCGGAAVTASSFCLPPAPISLPSLSVAHTCLLCCHACPPPTVGPPLGTARLTCMPGLPSTTSPPPIAITRTLTSHPFLSQPWLYVPKCARHTLWFHRCQGGPGMWMCDLLGTIWMLSAPEPRRGVGGAGSPSGPSPSLGEAKAC